MKKITTLSLLTLLVTISIFPALSLSNKVEALTYNNLGECTEYSDDFSLDTSDWKTTVGKGFIDATKEVLIVNPTLDGNDGKHYSAIALDNKTTTEFDYKVQGDFTITFKTGNFYTQAPDSTFLTSNAELIILGPNGDSIENIFRVGGQLNRDQTSEFYVLEQNIPFDTYKTIGSTDIETNLRNGFVFVKIIKNGTRLNTYYSTDNGYSYTLLTDTQVYNTHNTFVFRFTGTANYYWNTSFTATAEIDEFYVDCSTEVPNLIPNPEPDPDFIDTENPYNVERFFNKRIGSAHFYSIDPEETKFVEDNSKAGGLWPNAFSKEKPTFAAFRYDYNTDYCKVGTSPVYRFLNKVTGDTHFYAAEKYEMDVITKNYSDVFKNEGISFCVYLGDAEGRVPVYRWQNKILGSTHFYSADPEEKDYVDTNLTDTFKFEKTSFYAMPVQ